MGAIPAPTRRKRSYLRRPTKSKHPAARSVLAGEAPDAQLDAGLILRWLAHQTEKALGSNKIPRRIWQLLEGLPRVTVCKPARARKSQFKRKHSRTRLAWRGEQSWNLSPLRSGWPKVAPVGRVKPLSKSLDVPAAEPDALEGYAERQSNLRHESEGASADVIAFEEAFVESSDHSAARPSIADAFSPTEHQIIAWLAVGVPEREVAERAGITRHKVRRIWQRAEQAGAMKLPKRREQ